ncbi:MAG: transporter, partial [Solirubrobacteraceae bacterium]|nr:transporter [Solirubrobacteraceae bacterium]
QGIGAAFMMPGTLSINSNAFPQRERGKAIGTWAGVSAMALAIGPVVGGFLVEHVSWQSIFFLNVPIGIAAVFVTLFAATESRDETVERVIDIPGVATITTGLAALVLALVEANHWGWGSGRIVTLLAVAVVGLVGFYLVERHGRAPMVDFTFFRSRQFFGANVVAFIVSFSMLATFFFLALYMQNIQGFSPLSTGVRFLPSTVLLIALGPIAGRLVDKVGSRALMVTGLTLVSISLLLQSFVEVHTAYAYIMVAFVLMGLGMGMTMSPMSTAAMNAVEATKAGVASGILSMSRMVGGTFGIAALGALVSAIGRHDLNGSLPTVSAGARNQLAENLGSIPPGRLPPHIADAAREAFVHALQVGLKVGAGVAFVGAVVAASFIQGRQAHRAAAGQRTAGAPVEA